MINKRKKKFFNLQLNPKIFTFVISILIILISIPLFKNISRRNQINKEIQNLQNEIKETENKNTDLQKLLTYLNSQQFTEEQARLNLGLKKDGEQVVIVKGADSENTEITPIKDTSTIFNIPGLNTDKKTDAISFPSKWWRYFFK